MMLNLWEAIVPNETKNDKQPVFMKCYPIKTWHLLPAVIILPGGGYCEHASHEGEEIAKYYNEKGLHAFVVEYRLIPHKYPSALRDVQRAIKILKNRAEEFKIDVNMMFVIGFSAGGHLAGCVATKKDCCKAGDQYDEISPTVTGVLMGYPLISNDSLNDTIANECIARIANDGEELSLEKCVTKDTLPCFVWHTFDDEVVSVSHSLRFCSALKNYNIPFELHIYPNGPHGLGLAKTYWDISEWTRNSVRWMLSFRSAHEKVRGE